MRATRAMAFAVLISAGAVASSATRSGQEGFADEQVPRFAGASPQVIALSERDDRLYWRTVNDDLLIAYGGGVNVVNSALKQFAETKGTGRDVILRPGPGRETTFEGGIIKCDVTFHVPGKLGSSLLGKAKTTQGEPIFDAEPTLTIFVGDSVPLKALKVPATLRVLELDDLRARYVAGLETGIEPPDSTKKVAKSAHDKVSDTTVRAQSSYALGSLSPLGEQVEKPLRRMLSDPELYVRLCAIQALGELGRTGAILDLEEIQKATKDERERKGADDAITKIRAAKPPEPGLSATIEAIHKFKVERK